ncbi:uncharacterized protein ACA1_144560 [Acanthamoeba castellanii str. Neff]|uniref:Uncharacterized protein n=1 Tax=Acanthamoeba castellanii (strain ATCC 30010 / Neff) TaxID=1257118 RepID=L8GCD9_ACACF|nr:uncharacterized protein ACA1_144560 [Acanthamoeba castellanii str. Neff]ELR10875.1 hypothetical protein ACA1_144560 [Acanthamoeba castellanii str. Neff]
MLPQRRSSSPVAHTPRELRLAQAQSQQPSSPATSTAAPAAEDDGRKAVGLGIRRPMRGRVGGEEDGEEERERRRREQEEIERLQREIERKEREDKEAKAKAESEKEKEKAKAKAHNADLGGEEIVKSTVDTTRVGTGGGGDDDDSTSDSDSDGDEIVFDEEDDRNESARRTKAALDAVMHKQGRTGSFWSSFFK